MNHHDTGDRVAGCNQADGGVLSGEEIDDADLETYFTNLRTRYNAIRGSTVTQQLMFVMQVVILLVMVQIEDNYGYNFIETSVPVPIEKLKEHFERRILLFN